MIFGCLACCWAASAKGAAEIVFRKALRFVMVVLAQCITLTFARTVRDA